MRILNVCLNNRNSNSTFLYSELKESFKQIDFEELSNALLRAKEAGFTHLYLSGADPFRYSKFDSLLKLGLELNYFIEVEVSNLELNHFLPILKNQNVENIFFVFAGTTPDINDRILGPGTFERNLTSLKLARKNNLPISIKYLTHHLNCSSLYDDFRFFKDFKFKKCVVQDVWPVGKINRDFLIKQEDVLEYWPLITSNRVKLNLAENNFQKDKFYRFIQGQEVIIDWNGDIKPFPFSRMNSSGNIGKDDFIKILACLSSQLNDLVLKAARENSFLNWDYYQKHLSGPVVLAKDRSKYDWSDANNIVLPSSFSVLLTRKCNFNCDFCEFECSSDKTEAIDIGDFEKLLREGKKIGISRIVLDGGEPLVYEHIKEAMRLCHRYGYEVTVLTNGWYFEDFLPQFQEYNIQNFIFGINGATAKTNDLIMGQPGAFDRVVKAVNKSKKLGFFTGLHLVIHPLNISELDRFFRLAKKWKIDYINTSRIAEVGRAKNNQALKLTDSQIVEFRKICQKHENFLKKIRFFSSYLTEERSLECKYLALNDQLSVHWDGKIALCSMIPMLNLPFKKIHDFSLMECLLTLNEFNRKFQADRNREFPVWRQAENPYFSSEYCIERLSKDGKKYFD